MFLAGVGLGIAFDETLRERAHDAEALTIDGGVDPADEAVHGRKRPFQESASSSECRQFPLLKLIGSWNGRARWQSGL